MAHFPALHTSDEMMIALSRLLLSERRDDVQFAATTAALSNISFEDFGNFAALANTNHVIVRGLEVFRKLMLAAQDFTRTAWAENAIAIERDRIGKAIGFLQVICETFREERLDVTVMKSLDHWPDLGSDLDLYTNSDPEAVCAMMQKRFGAQIAARSWGDRLAGKWNFNVPGLSEPVEIHMQRLGQTGEQLVLASKLPSRSRVIEIEGLSFRVPSASDRIMISTLQRMYRHFYFRLCDIVDSSSLIASGALDFDDLRYAAQAAGIWEGVATYLVIVSDYVRRYRGADLDLPKFVTATARFGGDLVYFGRDFLRVPIMPQSAALYRTQLAGLLRKRELNSSARLGLLPWLATAAAVGQKITGSDKGIW